MPNDQNPSHGRRPNFHRGRRSNERRGTERRHPAAPAETSHRDHTDVEQIMRDIRARISTRHGIDLSPQQIQELAARRLEAILEPRHASPKLLEQMRRAAGEPIEVPEPSAGAELPFDEDALYESHRGFVRTLRRLLNPILKLFFNPAPIATALSAQAVRNNAAAQREAELHARQAEWNALHYEIVQRLVTELARTTLEMQTLTLRVEAQDAKLDFNERRVRAMESATPQHPSSRPVRAIEPVQPEAPNQNQLAPSLPAAPGDPAAGAGSDSSRRRRRRRRGRRSGTGPGDAAGAAAASAAPLENGDDGEEFDGPEGQDVTESPASDVVPDGIDTPALEPAHHFSLLQPAERYPSAEQPAPETHTPADRQPEMPAVAVEAAEPSSDSGRADDLAHELPVPDSRHEPDR